MLLTGALRVSLNMALLGSAEIQSVNGLSQELTGEGPRLRWLYPVALVAGGRVRLAAARAAATR